MYMGKQKYFTYLHCSAIWDDFLQSKQDSSEGEQWGRYNLPRYVYIYNVGCLIVIPPPYFFLRGGQPSYNIFWESIAGIMICI